MPVPDFEIYKVAAGELSSATKFDNFVQAVKDEFADIDPDQIPGYPASVAAFLRGDGAWAGAFSTYVPAWTSSGAAPALGNGTLTGRYLQVGKLVYVTINLVAGTTTTFGTGQWILSLPVTQAAARIPIASVLYFDSSAGQFYPGMTWDASTTTVALYNTVSPMTAVTGTAPFAWATGDQVILSLVYEVS